MKKWLVKVLFGLAFWLIVPIAQAASAKFKTGADILCAAPNRYLKNKRIGILSQSASIVMQHSQPEHLVAVLHRLAGRKGAKFSIEALFTPEHGFYKSKEAAAFIEHTKHPSIGCPIYSLHGAVRKPSPAMLKGLNLVVIDLQDVGVRCSSYISTMANTIEAAAAAKIPVLVLDRPNPIKSWGTCGKEFDKDYVSFLAKVKIPFIHGMTMGEIAKKTAKECGAKLRVIATKGSQAKGLKYLSHHFVALSPNLQTLHSLFCYPITVALETTSYSEGGGTETPFELFGAPWVDGQALAKQLNDQKLAGVMFEATSFTPEISNKNPTPRYMDKLCGGVILKFTDRAIAKPLEISQAIVSTLFAMYPSQSQWLKTSKFGFIIDQMMAGPSWRLAIEKQVKNLQRVRV
jgi:uncharacterized protein YbbC (DUF1343 family)